MEKRKEAPLTPGKKVKEQNKTEGEGDEEAKEETGGLEKREREREAEPVVMVEVKKGIALLTVACVRAWCGGVMRVRSGHDIKRVREQYNKGMKEGVKRRSI